MLPYSKVWEKCDKCGSLWDGLRLKAELPDMKIVCPLCRGISDWAKVADDKGIVR